MIDYLEIRNAALELIGLIDTAKSIIWEREYFGVGAFEVYTEATPQALALLQCGNFITRADSDSIGIIEAVEIVLNDQDGRMISATGRLAKSILDRRIISYVNGNVNAAATFSGNVEASARGLVQDNAIACYKDKARTIPYTARNISVLQLGALAGLPATTESRQVACENLLTYTDEFLQQYGYGARMILSGGKLSYTVYSGKDRSIGNTAGNEPVIFSEDFDNLTGSTYGYDETGLRNYALVGGAGEGIKRFYVERGAELSGLARRELFIDQGSTAREIYELDFAADGSKTTFSLPANATSIESVVISDANGNEASIYYAFNAAARTITLDMAFPASVTIHVSYFNDVEYSTQLNAAGDQELSQRLIAENFEGSIDLTNSSFEFGTDFDIGDIVTVQDNGINKYINVRIVGVSEVQDDNGYQVNIKFEAVNLYE